MSQLKAKDGDVDAARAETRAAMLKARNISNFLSLTPMHYITSLTPMQFEQRGRTIQDLQRQIDTLTSDVQGNAQAAIKVHITHPISTNQTPAINR